VQQEGFGLKTSNISIYVAKITKNKYFYGLLLLVLIPFAYAGLSGSLSVEAITKRLEPMAQVNVDGADAAVGTASAAMVGVGTPKDIYENNCKMCHQTGLAGAPKMGAKGDWAPRITQGLDVLVKNAWVGIRAMPPKGNCLKCTEADIKATVEYMLEASK
jgi:cytochrome c5